MDVSNSRPGRVQGLLLVLGFLTLGPALWLALSGARREPAPKPVQQRPRLGTAEPPRTVRTTAARKSWFQTDGSAWAPSSSNSTTVARFSESRYDDSGYTLVSQFTGP